MLELMRRAGSLVLAGIAIAVSFECAIGEEANTTRKGDSASDEIGPGKFVETLIDNRAKARNNREKWVLFNQAYDVQCPRGAAFTYASGQAVGITLLNSMLETFSVRGRVRDP